MRNFKNLNYLIVVIKLLSSICDNCGSVAEKIFKEVESIEILKFPGLIENIQLFINIIEESINHKLKLKNIFKK